MLMLLFLSLGTKGDDSYATQIAETTENDTQEFKEVVTKGTNGQKGSKEDQAGISFFSQVLIFLFFVGAAIFAYTRLRNRDHRIAYPAPFPVTQHFSRLDRTCEISEEQPRGSADGEYSRA